MPVREKPHGGWVDSQPVPSLVPLPVQTAAKSRDFSGIASEGTAQTDSLLEGRGFEPLVPLTTETHFRAPIDAPSCAHGVKKDLLQPKGRPMVRIPFPPLASSTLVLREIELKAAVRAS